MVCSCCHVVKLTLHLARGVNIATWSMTRDIRVTSERGCSITPQGTNAVSRKTKQHNRKAAVNWNVSPFLGVSDEVMEYLILFNFHFYISEETPYRGECDPHGQGLRLFSADKEASMIDTFQHTFILWQWVHVNSSQHLILGRLSSFVRQNQPCQIAYPLMTML